MYNRGVRGRNGIMGQAVGQVHMPRDQAEQFIKMIAFFYPGQTNGTFSGAIELLINDFTNIAPILERNGSLDPEDVEQIIKIGDGDTFMESLAKIGTKAIREQEKQQKKKQDEQTKKDME